MSYSDPTQEEIMIRRGDLSAFDTWNERSFLSLYACILSIWGTPGSYLDIGSGTGAMVNMARRMGIRAYGVDVINGPEHWFVRHNLENPLYLSQAGDHISAVDAVEYDPQFDLVTCIEVAEHIPGKYADNLVDTIARHVKTGGLLIFSSAPPGQAGEHHVNCQPSSYWRDKLYEVGLSYRQDYTMRLSHIWSWVSGPMSWLASNVQVYDS